MTALHWAAQQGLADHITLLLEKGANKNAKSGKNAEPWHYAKEESIKALLKDGITPTSPSVTPSTPDVVSPTENEPERSPKHATVLGETVPDETWKELEQMQQQAERELREAEEKRQAEEQLKQAEREKEEQKRLEEQKQEELRKQQEENEKKLAQTKVDEAAPVGGAAYSKSELESMPFTKLKELAKSLGGPKFFSSKTEVVNWLNGKIK